MYSLELEPDRSKSDYFCRICHSHMNSRQMWDNHIAGKRHIKNLKKQDGQVPSKVKSIKVEGHRANIQDELDEYGGPLLGLSFVAERQASVVGAESIYYCHLCQGSNTRINIIEHMETTKHKLAFFKQRDEQTFKLITSMKHLSKASIEALVSEHAERWEEHHGREAMQVELRKPTDWAPSSRRNPLANSWNDMFRKPYSSSKLSSEKLDTDLQQPSVSSTVSSAPPMEIDCEDESLSMTDAKKNFEKFSVDQKVELVMKLIDKMLYNTFDDFHDALRVYSAVSKINMVCALRNMTTEHQERVYKDLVVIRTKLQDVLKEVLLGKKSYYGLRRPFAR